MSGQAANVIDFESYRRARAKPEPAAVPAPMAMSYHPVQPVLIWVPLWGFVPFMLVGNPNYGT